MQSTRDPHIRLEEICVELPLERIHWYKLKVNSPAILRLEQEIFDVL